VPRYENLDDWDLRVFGAVEEEARLTYDELTSMPTTRVVADVHCVTRWSKFDTVWEGVRFRDLVARVRPLEGAEHVIVHAEYGFTANLPLARMTADNVLLAWKYGDGPLAPEHGWPLRLVVPDLYFWKSVKWVRGLEFAFQDRPGFWEQAGYHNEGDPWKEQRYAE
jgi:DMSO/TMAO reductase YedYZ molybdopterin-dependent catalytic subunit